MQRLLNDDEMLSNIIHIKQALELMLNNKQKNKISSLDKKLMNKKILEKNQ